MKMSSLYVLPGLRGNRVSTAVVSRRAAAAQWSRTMRPAPPITREGFQGGTAGI